MERQTSMGQKTSRCVCKKETDPFPTQASQSRWLFDWW